MQTWLIILLIVIGILVGFLIGIIFYKLLRRRHIIGDLVVISESDKEPPYIYLELDKNVDAIYSKRYAEFNVRYISHK